MTGIWFCENKCKRIHMQISSIRLDLNKTLGFINNREIDPKNVYRITNSSLIFI